MPKTYPVPNCSEKDRQLIEGSATSRTMESRLVERARIIERCLRGEPILKIAQESDVRPYIVIDRRRRLGAKGIAALKNLFRSAKPPTYSFEDSGDAAAIGAVCVIWPSYSKTFRRIASSGLASVRKERICLIR